MGHIQRPVGEDIAVNESDERDDEVGVEAAGMAPDAIARWERLRILIERMQLRKQQQ